MSRQYLFMKLRNDRQQEVKPAFDLEFNDDNYAIATPTFWRAWRGDKNTTRGKTISLQYAPAKYPADQLGLPGGNKPVWIVFQSKDAKRLFEGNQLANEAPCPRSETLKGLGWQANTDNTGMFFDDRVPKKQGVLVAWLNYRDTLYSVNVVHSAFKLTRPIPSTINTLGEAVEWVYNNSVWRPKPERRAE